MYKNLVKEYLKKKFFEDKDVAIDNYLKNSTCPPEVEIYTYTSGKKVIINKENAIAYSRNGFFFSVILKDEDYIQFVEDENEEWLECLNNALASKYETEEELETEGDE